MSEYLIIPVVHSPLGPMPAKANSMSQSRFVELKSAFSWLSADWIRMSCSADEAPSKWNTTGIVFCPISKLLFQDGSNGEVVPLPEEASGKGQIRYPCAGARETANATANTQSMNFRLKLFINKSVWCRSYAFPALGLFYFNYLSAILIFFPLTGA